MTDIPRCTRFLALVSLAAVLSLYGCMPLQTRGAAGRGTGYGTLDLSIGVLPVGGSLNPDQNMYPGFAPMLDEQGFFSSIEPVASAGGTQFDLLLQAGPASFVPDVKIMSGYSGKVLWQGGVNALYGTGGRRFASKLAKIFAVGTPAYQQVIAEREVFRSQRQASAKPASAAPQPAPILSDVDKPAYESPRNPDNFAVVVGVEKYPGLPPAEFAERDAQAVLAHLLALGYPRRNIAFLTGEQASKAGISKNIETWLPKNVNENSSVFFYFSGHGAPKPDTGDAFLLPADGDPLYLDDTAYPLKRLYEKLNALPAKRVVAAIDSCFSGAGGRSVIAKGTRPLVVRVDTGNESLGQVYSLTASAADQTSGVMEDQGHGLFTYFLLKGLNGAAKDNSGRVTLKGVYDYLKPRVADEGRRLNRDQTPLLHAPQDLVLRED